MVWVTLQSVFSMICSLIAPVLTNIASAPIAQAAVTASIDMSGLINGSFPGAPIKASSSPFAVLKLGVAVGSSGTLTSVQVDLSGAGFVTGDLASIVTATSSGVALYDDTGSTAGSFDSGDQVVRLAGTPDWSSGTSSVVLTPASTSTVSLTSTPTLLYVVVRTASGATNGHKIIASVPADGIVTSDGNGPASPFSSNFITVDTVAPTVASCEGFLGSANLDVRFSEPVQKVGGGALLTSSLTYTDGGGGQTISSLSHEFGREFVRVTLDANIAADDLDGSPASCAAASGQVADMAGNVAGTSATNLSSPLSLTTSVVPATSAGTTYTSGSPLVTFAASGGTAPYAFTTPDAGSAAVLTSLGLSLASNGKLTGTVADVSGSFSFGVKVTDSAGTPAERIRTYTVNVAGSGGGAIPGILSVSPPGGPSNTASMTVSLVGVNTHFTSASQVTFTLPPGVSGTNGVSTTTGATVTASDSTHITFPVMIASGASAGSRDLRIQTASEIVNMPNAFAVFADAGGSGLTQLLPTTDATSISIPPGFSFSQSSNGTVVAYRIKVFAGSSSDSTVLWDYAFPKGSSEETGHCSATQCNLAYGQMRFRRIVSPAVLAPNTTYYWQVLTYATSTPSVDAAGVLPVESTPLRGFTTVATLSDVVPPSIFHRDVFRATESAALNVFARVVDNYATALSTPALTAKILHCRGNGCTPTTQVTGTVVGNGYYKFTVPAAADGIGGDGTYMRYLLRASDGVNTVDFPTQGVTTTAVTAGAATIAGTVLDSSGTCSAGVQSATVFVEGTGFSATTNGSCAFTLSNMFAGTYELVAVKEGYGERRVENIPTGTSGLALNLGASGFTGGFGGDTSRPRVTDTCPIDGQRNLPGGDTNLKICVSFSESMSESSISAAGNLTLNEVNPSTGALTDVTAAKGSWTYYPTAPSIVGVPARANTAVYTLTSPIGDNKTMIVKVGSGVTDTAGNAIQNNQPDGSYAISFNTGVAFGGDFEGGAFGVGAFIPPRVSGSIPAPGAVGFATNTQMLVMLSEPGLDDGGSYVMRNFIKVFLASDASETNLVSSAVLDSTKKVARLTLGSQLSGNTRYRLKVLGGLKAASGLTLGPPDQSSQVMYMAEFLTGTSQSVSAPTITGSFPDNAATSVPVNTPNVGVGFSIDMDPSTISSDSVQLTVGSTVVNGTVEYRPLERQVVFVPRGSFSANTEYTLTITTDVQGLNGVALAAAATRTFTTGDADTAAPRIAGLNADDHAVVITWSEPMNFAGAADTINYPRSVINPSVILTAKQGAAGFDPSSAGTAVSLSGARFSYDPLTNTTRIEGVSLTSGNDLYIAARSSGANAPSDRSGNTMGATGSTARVQIRSTAQTGGALGPGEFSRSAFETGGSFVPDNFSSSTIGFMRSAECRPRSPMAGQTTTYSCNVPLSQSIPAGTTGKIVLTFPSGFDVTNAKQQYSPMHDDINGPATGTIKPKCSSSTANVKTCSGTANADDTGSAQGGLADDGVVVDTVARSVTLYLSGATQSTDFINFEIGGVKNSTIARGFDTSGYTVDIKTFNDSAVLDSYTSMPFFLQSAGSNTVTGTITMSGNDQTCTVNVFMDSPISGMQSTQASFTGGSTATYTFSNVPNSDVFIRTDRSITCGSGGSAKEFVGKTIAERVSVVGNTTYNLTLASASTGGTAITVTVVGGSGKTLDLFLGSQTDFVVRQISPSTSPEDFTIRTPSGFTSGFLGVGPSINPDSFGPPAAIDFVPPKPKDVKLDGSVCNINGTFGCSATFTLTSASKAIKGIVKDTNGLPMANTEVFAHADGFGSRGQTDASGQFSLPVSEGTYKVGAFFQGIESKTASVVVTSDATTYLLINGATTAITPAAAQTAFVLTMAKPDCTISGKVTDGTNVIQNAGVFARRTDGTGFSNAMTNSSGNYTLYVGCSGTYSVEAFAPGYGQLSAQSVTMSGSSQSSINFTPTLGSRTYYTVSGNVTSGGTAVQGAIVRIKNGTFFTEAVTDVSGDYSVRVASGSAYTVEAIVKGVRTPPSATFDVTANVTGKDVTVSTPRTVTIVFSEVTPAAFVDLTTTSGISNHSGLSNATSVSITVPNGTYLVKIGTPGIAIGCSDIAGAVGTSYTASTCSVVVDGTETLNVTMPTLRTISGTVTDGSTAVPNAWVEVVKPGTSVGTGVQADSSGNFTLYVADGTYAINAMKYGYFRAPTPLTVTGNLSGQTLAMSQASLTISGQVLIAGSGAANAFVRAERQGGGFAVAQADNSGNYSLTVADGTWQVKAVAEGYAEGQLSAPVVISGSSATGQNITLSTAATFSIAQPGSQPITTSNGGTIQDTDAKLKMVIPANALSSDGSSAIVSYTQTTNVPSTPGAKPLPGFNFSAQTSDGVALTNFNQDIPIEISYTPAELADMTNPSGSAYDTIDEVNALQMGTYDETTNSWTTLASTVTCEDSSGNPVSSPSLISECTLVTIAATAPHFSLYAPIEATDPSAADTPSGFAAVGPSATQVNLSWTQVSGATGYDIYRSTSAGGTYTRLGSEPTVSSGSTVSYSDTGLTPGTTYFYKMTAINGSGESAATTYVSITMPGSSSASGGGGSTSPSSAGGGGSSYSSPSVTTSPTTSVSSDTTQTTQAQPTSAPVSGPATTVQAPSSSKSSSALGALLGGSDAKGESTYGKHVSADAKEFKLVMTPEQADLFTKFIVYGTRTTLKLGSGERRAVLRDALETMARVNIPFEDFDRMTMGEIPKTRNLPQERIQLPRVRATFRTIYGHDPNFKDASENLAWNTLMYRIRFPRDLAKERQGIVKFKKLFNKNPSSPLAWAAVRALGYIED